MAFLNKGKKFLLEYKVEGKISTIRYCFRNGLADKLKLIQLNGIGHSIFESHEEKIFDHFKIQVTFAFRNYNVDSSLIQSYCNHYPSIEHGMHVQGLLKGLTYGVMKYFQKQGFTTEYKISQKGIYLAVFALQTSISNNCLIFSSYEFMTITQSVTSSENQLIFSIKENLIAIIHIQLDCPNYSGCVRNKLANPEIIKPIKEWIAEVLFLKMEADEVATGLLIQKFEV